MNYAVEATYYRTALLLGLVRGDVVVGWAVQAIERDPKPPQALLELACVPPTELSELRHALWPLVVEPDPQSVLEALLGVLHADLTSDRRGLADTIAIIRQMRSMLRLPPQLYSELNAVLVAYATEGRQPATIANWLGQFKQSGLPA